jgi:hypothetical protein
MPDMKYKIFLLLLLPFHIVSCSSEKNDDNEIKSFQLQAGSLVTKTFDTLRNTLSREIGEKGFAGAVDFCNINALPLTGAFADDEIAIRRTTDKLRNPANAPDSMERRILLKYLSLKTREAKLEPITERDAAGNYHFYKPIIIQAMCLNCHGDKTSQIHTATWAAIRQKYPSDAAFDYKEGDLRGIWHVKWTKIKK